MIVAPCSLLLGATIIRAIRHVVNENGRHVFFRRSGQGSAGFRMMNTLYDTGMSLLVERHSQTPPVTALQVSSSINSFNANVQYYDTAGYTPIPCLPEIHNYDGHWSQPS
jgi:hypothetical protein